MMQTFVPSYVFVRVGSGIWLGYFLFCFAFAEPLAASQKTGAERTRQPNIVLVMADDLGISELGCYGSKELKTPNIDSICRSGLKFNCAYSGSTVCAPARCILMTGQHAGQCSVRVNCGGVPLPDRDVTLAEMLRSVGYATGGFGKWALGVADSEGDPLNQGFDEFYGYYHQTHAHSHYAEYLIDNGKKIRIDGNIGANLGYEKDGLVPDSNPSTGKPLVYVPYLLMHRAKQFIRKNAERPFFCYLPLTVPHGHFHIPESDPSVESLKDRAWSGRAKAVGAMTQLLDRQMGELIQLLKELNIDDNTIVIFCSDHGAALRFEGELDASGPFRGFKRSMYEGGLRIPLIVRWPNRIKPAVSDHVAYLGDIFSTLKDVACQTAAQRTKVDELLASQKQASVSFAPTMFGQLEKQTEPEFLFWEFYMYNPSNGHVGKKRQALRAGKWKILRHAEEQAWELYDLVADPYEAKNIAATYSKKVKELESVFNTNLTPPMRQQEALVDWTAPFTWATRDRFQKHPEPSLDKLIQESEQKFKNRSFGEDAVMLGMTRQQSQRGLVQINIGWRLKKDRRPIRFIHVCDSKGNILRQVGANNSLFEELHLDKRVVDSFVLTPKQLESADFVAVGFYGKVRGTAKVVDQSGKVLYSITVFKVESSK